MRQLPPPFRLRWPLIILMGSIGLTALAAFDAIPPLQMTAAEEAEWRAARDARKVADAERIDRLAARLSGTPE